MTFVAVVLGLWCLVSVPIAFSLARCIRVSRIAQPVRSADPAPAINHLPLAG